ncbi:hypothetical protein MM440_03760 [Arsenicicoccus piscis]|uniref:Uncharacterized protein n=1 Tax=Arsenicicoccus piscis TaxID=673954 RepID=A0ABQ6HL38_9MICO|nr:hypothetical protein [Arsenicicoccus piscis]MCH8626920.1 hypothetical protein [Arsenicicoccus piscis]GMA19164.1 hypothetical protein GCM10025862_11850 [Arsenicicoccus piscis]
MHQAREGNGSTRRGAGFAGAARRGAGFTGAAALGMLLATTLAGCGGATTAPTAPSTSAPSSLASAVATPSAAVTQPLTAGRLPPGAPASYAQAVTHVDRARPDPTQPAAFRTPSGNIACVLGVPGDDQAMVCEITEGAVASPTCGDATSNPDGRREVGRLVLKDGVVDQVCNSDTVRTGPEPVLAYGRSTSVPQAPVQCVSESTGVTCIDRQRRAGFTLARGGYLIWR